MVKSMAYVYEQPKVFSYVRFSSEIQSKGDSHRRQIALAEKYAIENGLELDTSSYQDLGISAFKKNKNNLSGKFGEFLEGINIGKIRPGSILIVESLDRISRQDANIALSVLLQIINAGIKVVTTIDNMVYDRDTIGSPAGATQLLVSLMIFIRANDESRVKSERVRQAWKNKFNHAETKVVTKMLPAWISLDADGKMVFNEKADIVRRIIKMSQSGIGFKTISERLNAEGVPTLQRAKVWTGELVSNIFRGPKIAGVYSKARRNGADRDCIYDYYPKLIELAEYNELKKHQLNRTLGKGNRKDSTVRNLLPGRLYCANCGSKVRLIGTSMTNGLRTFTYMRCTEPFNSSTSECREVAVNMNYYEPVMLREVMIAGGNFHRLADKDKSAASLTKLRIELDQQEKNVRSIADVLERLGGKDDIFFAKYVNAQALKTQLQKQIEEIEKSQISYSDVIRNFEELFTRRMTEEEMTSEEHMQFVSENRRKMRDLLCSIIERVDISGINSTLQITYKTGSQSPVLPIVKRYANGEKRVMRTT